MCKLITMLTATLAALFMSAASVQAANPQPKILVLTERGGQHESFASTALEWLDEFCQEHDYQMTVINTPQPIDSAYLSQYALFIQLDFPPYTWSDTAKKAFEASIDKGRLGWVGFHHATLLGDFDGWKMWDWFSDFMGGIRFKNYIAETAAGTIHVERTDHPVMVGVSDSFVLPDDEWYTYDRNPRPNVTVLATVDEESYIPASDVRMGDHPVVWVNESKKARNVYFLFGHAGTLFDSQDFRRMFANAILWAIGQ